ncbi:MAG: helix-turn-helix domain-containing protein [Prevotella sp.]
MLRDDNQPFCNVNGYAERLHITPKYLSSVCKHATGKTASQLINEEIIRMAKLLLHDNKYSIKQIADLLGFANQSHFGVFSTVMQAVHHSNIDRKANQSLRHIFYSSPQKYEKKQAK